MGKTLDLDIEVPLFLFLSRILVRRLGRICAYCNFLCVCIHWVDGLGEGGRMMNDIFERGMEMHPRNSSGYFEISVNEEDR